MFLNDWFLDDHWSLTVTLTACFRANVRNCTIVTVVSIKTTAAEFIGAENILDNGLNRLNLFVYRLDWLINWDWFFDDLDWFWDWNSYDWDIFARTEPTSCLTESRNG